LELTKVSNGSYTTFKGKKALKKEVPGDENTHEWKVTLNVRGPVQKDGQDFYAVQAKCRAVDGQDQMPLQALISALFELEICIGELAPIMKEWVAARQEVKIADYLGIEASTV